MMSRGFKKSYKIWLTIILWTVAANRTRRGNVRKVMMTTMIDSKMKTTILSKRTWASKSKEWVNSKSPNIGGSRILLVTVVLLEWEKVTSRTTFAVVRNTELVPLFHFILVRKFIEMFVQYHDSYFRRKNSNVCVVWTTTKMKPRIIGKKIGKPSLMNYSRATRMLWDCILIKIRYFWMRSISNTCVFSALAGGWSPRGASSWGGLRRRRGIGRLGPRWLHCWWRRTTVDRKEEEAKAYL